MRAVAGVEACAVARGEAPDAAAAAAPVAAVPGRVRAVRRVGLTGLTGLTGLLGLIGLTGLSALAGIAPAMAASSASSAVSDSVATSVGSVSDSLRGSSRSSTPGPRLAAGEYRVVEIAAAERPGRLVLTLALAEPGASAGAAGESGPAGASAAPSEPVTLELPAQALARAPLVVGDRVAATPRPFGIEFARVATREAFFLVLDDAWYRELSARPLV